MVLGVRMVLNPTFRHSIKFSFNSWKSPGPSLSKQIRTGVVNTSTSNAKAKLSLANKPFPPISLAIVSFYLVFLFYILTQVHKIDFRFNYKVYTKKRRRYLLHYSVDCFVGCLFRSLIAIGVCEGLFLSKNF